MRIENISFRFSFALFPHFCRLRLADSGQQTRTPTNGKWKQSQSQVNASNTRHICATNIHTQMQAGRHAMCKGESRPSTRTTKINNKQNEKEENKEPPVAQRFSYETLFQDPLTIWLYIVTILFILLSLSLAGFHIFHTAILVNFCVLPTSCWNWFLCAIY